MNTNIRIFLFCPVPENQKPMVEFLLFQDNSFFQWISFSKKKYEKKLFLFSFSLFFLCFLILSPFFSFKLSFSFFVFNFFFFIFLLFCFFFNLFLRCFELENRLESSRLFYEEGSWYDGQIWEKPLSLIENERLITTQKVQPLIQRICPPFFFLFFFSIIILFFYFLIR